MQTTGSSARQRRPSRRGRFKRLLRSYWPFALVLAAALLSAGVVTIVESGPRPEAVEDALREPPSFEGVDHLLDLELFDQRLFWDPENLEGILESQQEEIILDGEGGAPIGDPDLSRVLPGSFIDDTVDDAGALQPDPGAARIELDQFAPLDLERVAILANPEPSTGSMLFTGLLLLSALRSAA